MGSWQSHSYQYAVGRPGISRTGLPDEKIGQSPMWSNVHLNLTRSERQVANRRRHSMLALEPHPPLISILRQLSGKNSRFIPGPSYDLSWHQWDLRDLEEGTQ